MEVCVDFLADLYDALMSQALIFPPVLDGEAEARTDSLSRSQSWSVADQVFELGSSGSEALSFLLLPSGLKNTHLQGRLGAQSVKRPTSARSRSRAP